MGTMGTPREIDGSKAILSTSATSVLQIRRRTAHTLAQTRCFLRCACSISASYLTHLVLDLVAMHSVGVAGAAMSVPCSGTDAGHTCYTHTGRDKPVAARAYTQRYSAAMNNDVYTTLHS